MVLNGQRWSVLVCMAFRDAQWDCIGHVGLQALLGL